MVAASPMQRYTEYNDQLKAQGIELVNLDCPACKQKIETQPSPKGAKLDTISECPSCNALFMKITEGNKAYGLLPNAQSEALAQVKVNQGSSNLSLKSQH